MSTAPTNPYLVTQQSQSSPTTPPVTPPQGTSPSPSAVRPTRLLVATIREWATPISLITLAFSITMYTFIRPGDLRPATIDAVQVGRDYAPILVKTYADAWDNAAAAIAGGHTMVTAQKVLQDSWKDARVKAFDKNVAPSFERIVPSGTKDLTPSQQAEIARVWRDFARGLRRGK